MVTVTFASVNDKKHHNGVVFTSCCTLLGKQNNLDFLANQLARTDYDLYQDLAIDYRLVVKFLLKPETFDVAGTIASLRNDIYRPPNYPNSDKRSKTLARIADTIERVYKRERMDRTNN